MESLHQSALLSQHGGNDGHDTEEHDDALDEVVHRRGAVTAQNHVYSRQDGHDDYAVFVGNAEAHLEERADALVDTGCIGNQEHEGDDRGHHAESL